MKLRKYPLSVIGELRQGDYVKPGERKRIFYLKIPNDLVAFINYYTNTWAPNVVLELYIDGEFVRRIERESERTIDPPYVAEDRIEVYARNNDKEEHFIEFEVDGVAVLRKELGITDL